MIGSVKNYIYRGKKIIKLLISAKVRKKIARLYLRGNGIEIGALFNPLKTSKSAHVNYLDRMSVPHLRKQYPELQRKKIVHTDIIDNGEYLHNIKNCTQDFVIANHFLEHCQNPILAIKNMLRVLKMGGVLYFAIPNKLYTFDANRSATSIDHLMKDYTNGPEWSKKQHFEEWVHFIDNITDKDLFEKQVNNLIKVDYSIHYHTWTQRTMIEFFTFLQNMFNFKIELTLKNYQEVIFILRKI